MGVVFLVLMVLNAIEGVLIWVDYYEPSKFTQVMNQFTLSVVFLICFFINKRIDDENRGP